MDLFGGLFDVSQGLIELVLLEGGVRWGFSCPKDSLAIGKGFVTPFKGLLDILCCFFGHHSRALLYHFCRALLALL